MVPEMPRKKMRLDGFDYRTHGAYFITICCCGRQPLFQTENENQMVTYWLNQISRHFPQIKMDCFVVMPDHIHFIIWKQSDDDLSVATVIQWFKTMTTNVYIQGVQNHTFSPYEKKVWQRGYYDHIIRNDADLNEKRQYIINNPLKCE